MSCVLRIIGKSFEPDECSAVMQLNPYKIYRVGQPQYPKSKPEGPMHKESGVFVEVSGQDGDHVPVQIDDAVGYLRSNMEYITAAVGCAGVDDAYLDFSWWFPMGENAPVMQYNLFGKDLLSLCAESGLGLVVTVSAVDV